MDVAAHDAVAAAAGGERLQVLLEAGDEADGRLHLALDGLREGEVLLAAPGAPLVVEAVDIQQHLVADVAQHREPAHLGRHRVEGVAVDAEEPPALQVDVDVFLGQLDAVEGDRDQVADEVVVVAAQVDDLGAVLLRHLHDAAEDGGVGGRPVVLATQRPEVDDVAVQDQLVAADAAEHIEELAGLRVLGAEVEVGQDERAEVDLGRGQRFLRGADEPLLVFHVAEA